MRMLCAFVDLFFFFFFKQKTAYEMRISDGSSDVCSSDLGGHVYFGVGMMHPVQPPQRRDPVEGDMLGINRQVEQQHAGHRDQPSRQRQQVEQPETGCLCPERRADHRAGRSEEHTSELQSLMRISYAVFCLKNKNLY